MEWTFSGSYQEIPQILPFFDQCNFGASLRSKTSKYGGLTLRRPRSGWAMFRHLAIQSEFELPSINQNQQWKRCPSKKSLTLQDQSTNVLCMSIWACHVPRASLRQWCQKVMDISVALWYSSCLRASVLCWWLGKIAGTSKPVHKCASSKILGYIARLRTKKTPCSRKP